MITFFSCPKGFDNPHINKIQRNAIESWLRLPLEKKIILCGNDPGVADICREYSLEHIAVVKTNEFGTPLLSDIFLKAEELSENELMCYINSDIITLSSFSVAINSLIRQRNDSGLFLATGRRWSVDINSRLDSNEDLDAYLRRSKIDPRTGLDYFIYRKGTFAAMPPFAVGRWYWDNWLPYYILINSGAYIDCTPSVRILHQNHSYAQTGEQKGEILQTAIAANQGPEGKINLALCGGLQNQRNLRHANFVLVHGKIGRHYENKLRNFLVEFKFFSQQKWYRVLLLKPFSVLINRLAILWWRVFYKDDFF